MGKLLGWLIWIATAWRRDTTVVIVVDCNKVPAREAPRAVYYYTIISVFVFPSSNRGPAYCVGCSLPINFTPLFFMYYCLKAKAKAPKLQQFSRRISLDQGNRHHLWQIVTVGVKGVSFTLHFNHLTCLKSRYRNVDVHVVGVVRQQWLPRLKIHIRLSFKGEHLKVQKRNPPLPNHTNVHVHVV